ncbi:MAG: phenylalanine--tRNA ligase subunit alpha [Methanosarcinales archaeon]|nr:phenylalanine--tRNA ligase subunit alpha [Methanosarcinales archaeon]
MASVELSERDKLVLQAVSRGMTDPRAIAEKHHLPFESVISTADLLAEKGLVLVEKRTDEVCSLTPEGRKYAEEGLPERQILNLVASGLSMSELKDPSLKIGIGWVRKKGWATIDKGILRPSGQATPGKDEETLELLSQGSRSGSELDKDALAELKKRALVNSSTAKSWQFSLTSRGSEIDLDAAFVQGIKQLTPSLIKSGQWKDQRFIPYDVTLSSESVYPGKRHPYQRLIDAMRAIMLEMGFTEIKGDIVQSSFWNFDALFQPQDHPAREMQDTFYLDSLAEIPDYSRVKEMHERGGAVGSAGWGGCWSPEVARQEVLRTHTTSISIHYLADHPEPPVKAFCIDRVYRREAIDATHTPEFEQLEGIIMDRGVSFGNLLGFLKEFYAKMGFEEVRFRPGYFPYTEPSVEPEVWIDGLGWVELGGAGVFRREVTAPFGIEHPVLAWGLGVSRVAMLTLGLKDLRLLYQSDMGWLRETPVSVQRSR